MVDGPMGGRTQVGDPMANKQNSQSCAPALLFDHRLMQAVASSRLTMTEKWGGGRGWGSGPCVVWLTDHLVQGGMSV
jgi:hypothetical protein